MLRCFYNQSCVSIMKDYEENRQYILDVNKNSTKISFQEARWSMIEILAGSFHLQQLNLLLLLQHKVCIFPTGEQKATR